MEYYSPIKRKILIWAATGVNLENFMLRERSQTQMATQRMTLFTWSVRSREVHKDKRWISACQGPGRVGGGMRSEWLLDTGFPSWLIKLFQQWHPTPVLLPGKSHGRRSLVGCSPWGREESNTTERLHFHFSLRCIGEGNGNLLQYSCLENPKDRGAWQAAVHGVAKSQTRLKRLSTKIYWWTSGCEFCFPCDSRWFPFGLRYCWVSRAPWQLSLFLLLSVFGFSRLLHNQDLA